MQTQIFRKRTVHIEEVEYRQIYELPDQTGPPPGDPVNAIESYSKIDWYLVKITATALLAIGLCVVIILALKHAYESIS
jgi:hypothetical protein